MRCQVSTFHEFSLPDPQKGSQEGQAQPTQRCRGPCPGRFTQRRLSDAASDSHHDGALAAGVQCWMNDEQRWI